MKVSVFVVTYNQEKYIRQCLDSILMQQVDFDYEVVIGEDHGTDHTRAICEEYAAKYPQIRLLSLTENLGIARNWQRVLSACEGEYIAMCEGDDYWTDARKLQKQVDIMEQDSTIGYVFSQNTRLQTDGSFTDMAPRYKDIPLKMDLHRLIACKMVPPPTQTVCFRRSLLPEKFPEFMQYANLQSDMALLFVIASQCNIAYLPEVTAVFRLGGTTSHQDPIYAVQTRQKLMRNLDAYTHYAYSYYLRNKNDDYAYLTYTCLQQGKWCRATYYFIVKLLYSLFQYPGQNLKGNCNFIKHYIKHIFKK